MATDYLVQEEDGTSKFELEDGSGFLILEENIIPPISGGSGLMVHHHYHSNGAWLLPFLLLVAGCRGVPWWQ